MKQLICEKNGKKSITRIFVIVSMIVAIIVTFTTKDIAMVTTWLGIASGAKIVNKFAEK